MIRFPALWPRLLVLLAVVAAFPALALDEGIDYTVIDKPARAEPGDDVEVLELFWYGCPHCYHLEPEIERWLKTKPEGATFRRLPAAANPRWVPHARFYFAAEMMGVLDKLHEPLFRAMHDEKRPLMTDKQLIAFAAEQGVDEEAFAQMFRSFPVDMEVRKAASLVQDYQIDGVPSIVVNGKYLTSATQTGSRAKMFDVIDALIAKEMGEKTVDEGTGAGG
jgi:protein dithiol oxidoreductase (disulfide-forming)